jgi:hypothetical protein
MKTQLLVGVYGLGGGGVSKNWLYLEPTFALSLPLAALHLLPCKKLGNSARGKR